MTKLLYSDITDKIRQAAFDVHKYFECGFLEKGYENALVYILKQFSLECQKQVPLKEYFENDIVVGEYFADLPVEGKIIIELKTVEDFAKIHFAQVKNYLKVSNLRLGILINFGKSKLELKESYFKIFGVLSV